MPFDRAGRAMRSLSLTVACGLALLIATLPAGAQQPASVPPEAAVPAAAPNPLPSVSIADLAATLLDAVVNISTTQTLSLADTTDLPEDFPFQDLFGDNGQPLQQIQGMGSGFVHDPSGIIVTNFHVIEGADEIWANFHDGSRLPATIVGVDEDTDVAVLRVAPPRPLVAVPFGDADAVRIGDWLVAIGNPYGLGGSVTLGILSGRNRDLRAGPFDDYLQTDAAINQGNSGGPLFNLDGEVIGMNTAIFTPNGQSAGVAFAVPATLISRVVDQVLEYGAVRRGRIGVRIQEVTPGIAEGFGLAEARGALVVQIYEGTPAEDVGLETGDIILAVNGRQINGMRNLPLFVSMIDVGSVVPITVLRAGETLELEITIQEVEPQPGMGLADGPEPAPPPEIPSTASAPLTAADLGITLEPVSPATRGAFDIADMINTGMVITSVRPGGLAAERGIRAGEILIEVGADPTQPPVATEAEVDERLATAQENGRSVVLLLLSDPTGITRFEWVRVGE